MMKSLKIEILREIKRDMMRSLAKDRETEVAEKEIDIIVKVTVLEKVLETDMMVVQTEGIEIDMIEENDRLMKADIGTVKLQEIETGIRMKDTEVIQEINTESLPEKETKKEILQGIEMEIEMFQEKECLMIVIV